MANVGHPDSSEYAPYYEKYIANVTEDDVLGAIASQAKETSALLARIGEEKGAYRYGPDKWTVKDLLGHVADSERIFVYRALAIARGDQTSLPGYDENEYAKNGGFSERSLQSIADEYAALRAATLATFRGFSDEAWQRRGNANNNPVTVRALAHILLGHERHHLRVLRERYGVS